MQASVRFQSEPLANDFHALKILAENAVDQAMKVRLSVGFGPTAVQSMLLAHQWMLGLFSTGFDLNAAQ